MLSQINLTGKLAFFRQYVKSSNRFVSTSPLRITDEIQEAINCKQPIVALESTIITHGLPYPKNIEMATSVEKVVRSNGAIPATIAFVNGVPSIGLDHSEIEHLASKNDSMKVSRRDIGYVMANKFNGGTTISSTMILAEKAGIKIFGTGGLGGVHKDSELTMDVSADLTELGRTKVAVICAGPKSILDVAKTMEFLETQGCFVSTYGSEGTNIPGFFTTDSGVKSPYNFDTFKNAAEIVHNGINKFGLNSGYLFCIPPPENIALDSSYIAKIISEAEVLAQKESIKGKDLTPFLLGKIAEFTKGLSVDTNLEVVFNNAAAAAKIAVELSKLETNAFSKTSSQPVFTTKIEKGRLLKPVPKPRKVDIAVIGSVAVDIACKFKSPKYHLNDSNPGTSSTAIGGVAYNVALASMYSGCGSTATQLVSQVGNDEFGTVVMKGMEAKDMSTETIFKNERFNTAKYISFHDKSGQLVVACADMDISENFNNEELGKLLKSINADIVLVDGNMSIETYKKILTTCSNSKIVFEPTSVVKAARIANLIKRNPHSFIFSTAHLPNIIDSNGYEGLKGLVLATPTVSELRTIHDELDNLELFDVENWFPVLDSLGLNGDFRNKLGSIKDIRFQKLMREGVLQQAFKILPYIPALAIKLGKDGLVLINISMNMDADEKPLNDLNPAINISSAGKRLNNMEFQMGVDIQYYDVPENISNIENMTGAGDSLAGVLIQQMAQFGSNWLFQGGSVRNKAISKAQRAAALSIQENTTISESIKQLE